MRAPAPLVGRVTPAPSRLPHLHPPLPFPSRLIPDFLLAEPTRTLAPLSTLDQLARYHPAEVCKFATGHHIGLAPAPARAFPVPNSAPCHAPH